ncbi:hypothetical protein [Celeribacter sp.]|uniref:hypothetical protein n=1 Tax=Celeribacter sp. TaxID=1890673 RepID=UPI003A9525EA
MIKLRPIADSDPVLDQSRLLQAMELAFTYSDTHDGIGLTQSKAFNRKFAHWMAEYSPWPDYKAEELLRLNKVLNEWDVAPAMVVHDLMTVMKLGRHVKGKFQVSKKASALAAKRGAFFAHLAETFLFRYNHARTARFEFTAPGNWDIFLNIINVEAEQGLTEPHLVKTLYGLERQGVYDREYYDYAGFVFTHVLRPLNWIGFLAETSSSDRRSEKIYWKTPLWRACLQLSTDAMVDALSRH